MKFNGSIVLHFNREDDKLWPPADKETGRQELEIKLDREHICFTVF